MNSLSFRRRMNPARFGVLATLVALLVASPCAMSAAKTKAARDADSEVAHSPTLGPIQKIDLPPQPPIEAEEAAKIESLIKKFAEIEKPDFGLSPTLSGSGFAPHPGSFRPGAFLIADHDIKISTPMLEIVKIGPRALPALMKHLDDATATRLIVKHEGFFGAMWYGKEVGCNPVRPDHVAIVGALAGKGKNGLFDGPEIKEHTITIGDVCFVAIGQITGAGYQALRYQPTACKVINSTSHDPALAKAVRELFPIGPDPARSLLDSLLADYATVGVFNGKTLDGWYSASFLQIAAVRRLLFYFSKETAEIIATRLEKFDVRLPKEADGISAWTKREVSNGVRTADFIEAVAWSAEPQIRAALTEVFRRTSDPEILIASAPGVNDTALIRDRVSAQLSSLPAKESGPCGDGYKLLKILGARLGADAMEAFSAYAKNGAIQRRSSVLLALGELRADWGVELLAQYLKDKRECDLWSYSPDSKKPEKQVAMRVCDSAAATITALRPALKFELSGKRDNLDRQIREMLMALSSPQKPT